MDCPEHCPVFDQRCRESCACPGEVNKRQPMGIASSIEVIIFRVGSMDNWFACEDACHDAPRARWSRTSSKLGKESGRSPNGCSTHPLALGNYKFAERRIAEVHRLVEQGIKHRREVAG